MLNPFSPHLAVPGEPFEGGQEPFYHAIVLVRQRAVNHHDVHVIGMEPFQVALYESFEARGMNADPVRCYDMTTW